MILRRPIAALLASATMAGGIVLAAAPSASAGGRITVDIASSPEKLVLLTELGDRFAKSDEGEINGQCITIRVAKQSSGAAETLLEADWPKPSKNGPRPVIWSPSASTWAGVLDQ